ncbi:MAG: hypothetical protein ABIN80_04195 [Dyadobacter sp.]
MSRFQAVLKVTHEKRLYDCKLVSRHWWSIFDGLYPKIVPGTTENDRFTGTFNFLSQPLS